MVRALVGVGAGKSTTILCLLSPTPTPTPTRTRTNSKCPKPPGRIPAKAGAKVMQKRAVLVYFKHEPTHVSDYPEPAALGALIVRCIRIIL